MSTAMLEVDKSLADVEEQGGPLASLPWTGSEIRRRMEGLRVRATGRWQAEQVEALDGIPAALVSAEVRDRRTVLRGPHLTNYRLANTVMISGTPRAVGQDPEGSSPKYRGSIGGVRSSSSLRSTMSWPGPRPCGARPMSALSPIAVSKCQLSP